MNTVDAGVIQEALKWRVHRLRPLTPPGTILSQVELGAITAVINDADTTMNIVIPSVLFIIGLIRVVISIAVRVLVMLKTCVYN